MKHKYAIYPYVPETASLVLSFPTYCKDCAELVLLSPNGSGLVGRDASVADNRAHVGKMVFSAENESVLSDCDRLIVMDSNEQKQLLDETDKLISVADRMGVKVKDYRMVGASDYTVMDERLMKIEEDAFIHGKDKMRASVILIGGLLNRENIEQCFFSVIDALRKAGKHVEGIGDSYRFESVGMWTYKRIFENKEWDWESKGNLLNAYIKHIDRKTYPDFIVVKAPDALVGYNDEIPNGYSIKAFLLSQAIKFDNIICGVPKEVATEQYVNMLNVLLINRYRSPLAFIHASNYIVDHMTTQEQKKISGVYDEDRLEYVLGDSLPRIPIINVFDEKCVERVIREKYCKIS